MIIESVRVYEEDSPFSRFFYYTLFDQVHSITREDIMEATGEYNHDSTCDYIARSIAAVFTAEVLSDIDMSTRSVHVMQDHTQPLTTTTNPVTHTYMKRNPHTINVYDFKIMLLEESR